MKKLVILGLCLLLCACGGKEKTVKTLNDFNEVCSNYKFNVDDNKINYTEDYILGTSIAKLDDVTIQMFIYKDKDYASSVQEENIEAFMRLKNTSSVITRDKGSNYYKYVMISNGYYMVSARIDNTLIFTKTVIDNRDLIEKILNELEY